MSDFGKFLETYLPSKDPFWRRFSLFWLLFNWRYIYVLLEDSSLFSGNSRILYVSSIREKNLLSFSGLENGITDFWMIVWNVSFTIILPFIFVHLYYSYFHDWFIKPIYKKFNKVKTQKDEDLSDRVSQEFKNIKLREFWEDEFKKEMDENEIVKFTRFYRNFINNSSIDGLVHIVSLLSNGITNEDIKKYQTLGYLKIMPDKMIFLEDKAYYIAAINKIN